MRKGVKKLCIAFALGIAVLIADSNLAIAEPDAHLSSYLAHIKHRVAESWKTYHVHQDMSAHIVFEIDETGEPKNFQVISYTGDEDEIAFAIESIKYATPFGTPPKPHTAINVAIFFRPEVLNASPHTATLSSNAAAAPAAKLVNRQYSTAQSNTDKLHPREIARRAIESTVQIIAVNDFTSGGSSGTGFLIGPGIVATNYHVVDDAILKQHIAATLCNQKDLHYVSRVIARDSKNDIALLYFPTMKAAPLQLAAPNSLSIGDPIYVLGNPEMLEGTFSTGIVSALHRLDLDYIQMTAPISHGSSGGPVLNEKAQVVGLSVKSSREGQNLNFAVPVASLWDLIKFVRSR